MNKCEEALDQPAPVQPDLKIVHVAAAALIDSEGKILLAQRPEGKPMAGLWEFPGGKIETGEMPEYALMRELEEELGIETRPCCFHPIAYTSHSYENFHLLMPLFVCRHWRGVIVPRENQQFAWASVSELSDYPMPEADIPLVSHLRQLL